MKIFKNSNKCSACGSKNTTVSYNEDTAQAVFGTIVPFKEKVIKCNTCEATFSGDNIAEDSYSKALARSKKESIALILGSFLKMGYSLAAMERALELPQRTMSQWKAGRDLSAAGVALLRIIKTYPWIIEVADTKYDSHTANELLAKNAIAALDVVVLRDGYYPESLHAKATITNLSIKLEYTKEPECAPVINASSSNQIRGALI
ncbi:MAG: hypothetical protein RDU76_01850 [Candidatus Edwardsbacteria bacterium]|nr:hypothetical protein [Candidatus Edwardsbacteria bacterium]